MSPSWRDGGFHYPRNDVLADKDGYRTLVEAMTGNVLLGYANLNVPDGLWRLYNEPWPASHHRDPALTQVDDGVDVLRAHVAEAVQGGARRLHFTVRRCTAGRGGFDIEIGRLPNCRNWTLMQGGQTVARGTGGQLAASQAFDIRAVAGGIGLTCPEGEALDFELVFEPRAA